ncbi:MAG: hypothetical protein WC637_20930 [Victivallales bacterium]|jgi:hypothetical protein
MKEDNFRAQIGVFLLAIFLAIAGGFIMLGIYADRIDAHLADIEKHEARLVQVQEASLREMRKGIKAKIDWSIPAKLPPVAENLKGGR